jgi:hypothetical protein
MSTLVEDWLKQFDRERVEDRDHYPPVYSFSNVIFQRFPFHSPPSRRGRVKVQIEILTVSIFARITTIHDLDLYCRNDRFKADAIR